MPPGPETLPRPGGVRISHRAEAAADELLGWLQLVLAHPTFESAIVISPSATTRTIEQEHRKSDTCTEHDSYQRTIQENR